MLARQNITITELNFTKQSGGETRGRGIRTSNRIDGLIIIALHYRVTSADWKLGYINKPFTLKCEMKECLPHMLRYEWLGFKESMQPGTRVTFQSVILTWMWKPQPLKLSLSYAGQNPEAHSTAKTWRRGTVRWQRGRLCTWNVSEFSLYGL